jgi:hypothetical protein
VTFAELAPPLMSQMPLVAAFATPMPAADRRGPWRRVAS